MENRKNHDHLLCSRKEILIDHIKRYLFLYLSLVVVAGAFIIPTVFPIYFREDDPQYMMWGISHRWTDAFNSSTGVMFSMYRPIQNLLWWMLYRLFGLNPFPYQVCITVTYGLSFVLFCKLASMMFSRRVALFSMLGYIVMFNYLTYVIFWFSDFTYVMELFFVNLSLCFLVRATRGGAVFPLLGVIAYACAVLSKEPSAILIPTVTFLFVFSRWNALESPHRQRIIALSLALGCAGLAWLTFTPGVRGRSGVNFLGGIAMAGEFILARWHYYSRILLSQTGVLLLVSSLYLGGLPAVRRLRHPALRSKYVLLGVCGIVALFLRRMPDVALVLLFLSFVPIVLLRKKEMPAVGWFVLPLAGIMTMRFFMRTYLVETAFGAAMLVGVAAEDLIPRLAELRLKRLPRIVRYGFALVVFALCMGVLAILLPNLATKLEALRIVSATRCNFRDAVKFVTGLRVPRPKYLIVVDYGDMGDGYWDYVDSPSDLVKAHLQKTMHGYQLDVFMKLISPDMPAVRNLKWLETATEHERLVLLTMNNAEDKFIQRLDLRTDILYECQRNGEKATVYRINVPNGWSLPKNQTRTQRP